MPWVSIMVAIVLIYDGVIFYSRWSAARDAAREQVEEEAERARKTLALQGGEELRIMSFYSSPGVIRRGEHANICYGVNAAKQVRLEPPVEDVWPSRSHCFQVAPREDTAYKLIAEDAARHAVSQTFVLKVTR